MLSVVQRVKKAKVTVDGEIVGSINQGVLALIGIELGDNEADAKRTVDKIINLRIFSDESDKMNRSVLDISGEALFVSNFTLCGDARKGCRPNFMNAETPEKARGLFQFLLDYARRQYNIKIETGVFQAMMDVESINDGPVAIWIQSKK